MRLINTKTLKLCEVSSDNPPPYAILSHTWGSDEVEFAQYYEPGVGNRDGYKKIRSACRQASKDAFEYIWIDTCCIDKSSSSELSEALNSMFRWYKNSKLCYAYLSDVTSVASSLTATAATLETARWWSRGWTLQELLAPNVVIFFDKSWQRLGDKGTLSINISTTTGIDAKALHRFDPDDWSVAQRMSWASLRFTSRTEDTAYSLMGLFGVHMPLLYGEGPAAFARLQEEIIKTTDDQSIFAYGCLDKNDCANGSGRDLFAWSPNLFHSRSLVRSLPASFTDKSHAMTNKGLRIELPLTELTELPSWISKEISTALPAGTSAKVGILACRKAGNDMYYGIVLLRTDRPSVYDRFTCQPIHVQPEQALSAQIEQIYIRRKGRRTSPNSLQEVMERFSIVVDYEPLKRVGYRLGRCVSFQNMRSSLDRGTEILSGKLSDHTLPAVFVFYSENSRIAIPIIMSVEGVQEELENQSADEMVAASQSLAFLQILKIREKPADVDSSHFLDSLVQNAQNEQAAPATTISAVRIKNGEGTTRLRDSLQIIASIHTHVKLNRVVHSLSFKVKNFNTLRSLPASRWATSLWSY